MHIKHPLDSQKTVAQKKNEVSPIRQRRRQEPRSTCKRSTIAHKINEPTYEYSYNSESEPLNLQSPSPNQRKQNPQPQARPRQPSHLSHARAHLGLVTRLGSSCFRAIEEVQPLDSANRRIRNQAQQIVVEGTRLHDVERAGYTGIAQGVGGMLQGDERRADLDGGAVGDGVAVRAVAV